MTKETIGRAKALSIRPFYRPDRTVKRPKGGWGVAVAGVELAGRWDDFQAAWNAGVKHVQEAG